MVATILGIFIIISYICHLIGSKLDDIQAKRLAEKKASDPNFQVKKRMEEKAYTFSRTDCVRGFLHVNGKTYSTFNTGTINLGSPGQDVALELWVMTNGCYVSDISVCGYSIVSGMPNSLKDDEAIEYMLNLLDHAANLRMITHQTAKHARSIINKFFDFGDMLDQGVIAFAPTGADYVWMGKTGGANPSPAFCV